MSIYVFDFQSKIIVGANMEREREQSDIATQNVSEINKCEYLLRLPQISISLFLNEIFHLMSQTHCLSL